MWSLQLVKLEAVQFQHSENKDTHLQEVCNNMSYFTVFSARWKMFGFGNKKNTFVCLTLLCLIEAC